MLLVRIEAQLFVPGTTLVKKQHGKRLVIVDLAQKERLDTFPVVLPARWTRELARGIHHIGKYLAGNHHFLHLALVHLTEKNWLGTFPTVSSSPSAWTFTERFPDESSL